MQWKLHHWTLRLAHPFQISRESRDEQRSLVVELIQEGKHGWGEAPEDTFYGQSIESMSAAVESCGGAINDFEMGSPNDLWTELHGMIPGQTFALAAIDAAAHDLHGKLVGKRTHQSLGLRWEGVPTSSYTIGIDPIETMVEKLRQRPDWSVYKIKLGTEHDVDIVRALRRHTDAVFRVDANCAWNVRQTILNSKALKALGVEFIEQPLPPSAGVEDKRRVFAESALPIVADEDCQVPTDVARCDGLFHGVNVKLTKCGGLTPAYRMLRDARDRGLKTMLGCMIESSVGISAAAQLMPLLDYADLDGAALLADDPASGVSVTNGQVDLSAWMGNGANCRTPI